MILLHAGLLAGRFLLWGEIPPPTEASKPAPKRTAKKATAPTLPYDAGSTALQEALEHVAIDLGGIKSDSRVLWLPTSAGQPLASSPLIAPPPETKTEAVLAPWMVSTVPLPYQEAIHLVARCQDQTVLAPGVIVGGTLTYWSTALRFAGALVARQQFLPGITKDNGDVRACWQPTMTAADRQHLVQLAQSMPGACRALGDSATEMPQAPALDVLTAFVSTTVDTLVRATAAPALPPALGQRKSAAKFASLHDQWLYALRAPDAALRAPAAELDKLTEEVHVWQRPVEVSTAGAFHLCFRLEEPPESAPESPWTLRYLLQGRDDPSLLVPVADAWSPRGRKASLLTRQGFQPREYLLTALGDAARLCPPIEQSLQEAEPSACKLDTAGANRFLTEQSWVLEQAGFGVLLPGWWTRKGSRQKLSVQAHVKSPPMQGGTGLRLEDLVQFEWKVALGDQLLTLAELEMMARLKRPLVRLRGQWVQVSAEEIEAALAFWKKQATATASVRDVIKMALGAAQGPGGLELSGVTATGWIDDFLKQLQGAASFEVLQPPGGFQGTLRPYQQRGYSWLAFLHRFGLGACLADDMGLGKTVQALALVQRNWESKGRRPTLLICPVSVVGNWKKEAERFTPDLPVLIHHGLKRLRGGQFAKQARDHALVLSSYALIHRDLPHLQEVDWGGVILDEAQNIKNPNTKQAKAARAIPANSRIALTGTPVENHVGDLWSLWQFLNPGFLGDQTEFRRNFFVPIQVQHDAQAATRLKRLTGPFLLRRLKTDRTIVADLPDKMEMKVFCNLTKEQASLYAALVAELDAALKDSEGIQRKGLILATLSKLKQVCNHPAQFLQSGGAIAGRSGKVARLTEMLDELLQEGDKALIFTQFTAMGEILQKHLQETFGREVLFLHGGVSRRQRDLMVSRFQQEADGPRLFLLSLKAGGTGLNLTAANHVFHFDRWWNPAVENQATDRAFRIGQNRNVQVHKFVCVGTLEEKIDEMIERKQAVAANVVGTGEAWLTELSNTQLKELFALRQEALGE